jgi:hypothetical protein
MTSTERSHRYRARLAGSAPATKPADPATKPAPDRRDEEIARLKAQIAELERDRNIAPQAFSKTKQEEFERFKRRWQQQAERKFEERVQAECKRRLDAIILPQYTKELEELEYSIKNRKGVMDRATYRKVLACLHIERIVHMTGIPLAKMEQSLTRRYDEAVHLFDELEKVLCDEKESPTQFRKMPRTADELMAMRRTGKRAKGAGISARAR